MTFLFSSTKLNLWTWHQLRQGFRLPHAQWLQWQNSKLSWIRACHQKEDLHLRALRSYSFQKTDWERLLSLPLTPSPTFFNHYFEQWKACHHPVFLAEAYQKPWHAWPSLSFIALTPLLVQKRPSDQLFKMISRMLCFDAYFSLKNHITRVGAFRDGQSVMGGCLSEGIRKDEYFHLHLKALKQLLQWGVAEHSPPSEMWNTGFSLIKKTQSFFQPFSFKQGISFNLSNSFLYMAGALQQLNHLSQKLVLHQNLEQHPHQIRQRGAKNRL